MYLSIYLSIALTIRRRRSGSVAGSMPVRVGAGSPTVTGLTTMPTTVLHVVFKRHELVLHHFVDNLRKGLNVCSWHLFFRILSLFLNNSTDVITVLGGCWSTQGRLITELNEFV